MHQVPKAKRCLSTDNLLYTLNYIKMHDVFTISTEPGKLWFESITPLSLRQLDRKAQPQAGDRVHVPSDGQSVIVWDGKA